MSTVTGERKDRIRELICEHLEIEAEELTDTGLFVEDYGADSLSLIDLLGSLEKDSGVVIDESHLGRLVSLDGVCAVMQELAGW